MLCTGQRPHGGDGADCALERFPGGGPAWRERAAASVRARRQVQKTLASRPGHRHPL